MTPGIEDKTTDLYFKIRNVRCFASEQEFCIRPLTFLIGENSMGKSTALGCFHALHSLISDSETPDFNIEPYQMGSFLDIVNNSSSKSKKSGFELTFEKRDPKIKLNIYFTGSDKRAEPVVKNISIRNQYITVTIKIQENETEYQVDFTNKNFPPIKEKIRHQQEYPYYIPFPSSLRFHFHNKKLNSSINTEREDIIKKQMKILDDLDEQIEQFISSAIENMAPIRSKPKRTYDPVREVPDPSGNDIPMFLMRVNMNEKDRWEEIYEQLVAFGKSSGLFTDIEIKRYGESIGEPFQLRLNVMGARANIIDTGYGVSQILPLLVRIFDSSRSKLKQRRALLRRRAYYRTFLLQQPEVHLHPRGQAELTSLLINNLKNNPTSFIIETHSDYMIDRARIEISKGNISPEHVSLIYFEPVEKEVRTHNLSFDKNGNLLGAPHGYRDFFFRESKQLLGFITS